MGEILLRLARTLPLSLTGILVMATAIGFTIYRSIRARMRAQAEERIRNLGKDSAEGADGEDPEPKPSKSGGFRRLERSFSQAVKRLERHVPNATERSNVPWVLLLGRERSRRLDMLAGSGLPTAFEPPEAEPAEPSHRLSWWFHYPGVLLDLGGGYVQTPTGRGADRRGWRRFLRLLQKHRPERPLDGVVVTIPLEDLLQFETGDDPATLSLEDRAADLQSHLADIQDFLGMRVPVTVLVTGCDRLRGFHGFTRALAERGETDDPARLDRPLPQMFGWSNPYDPQALFRSEWVDRAFDGIIEGLDASQAELYSGRHVGWRQADDVFLFPLAVRRLREPLRRVLDTLFRANTYQSGDLFRGLYLTGAGDVPADPAAPRPQHFLKDLLERKVFPETRLAEPLPDTLLSRNRRVLGTQIAVAAAAVILSLGLWWSWSVLEARNAKLQPFLEIVQQNLQRAQIQQANARPDLGRMQARAEELLQGMADLDARRYWSLFLPTSWSGAVNRRLEATIVRAYEDILFEALHLSFENRTETLICASGGLQAPAGGSVAVAAVRPQSEQGIPQPAALPELQVFAGYAEELERLEVHSRQFNGLPETESLEDLSEVVEYLFGTRLSADFFQNDALYHQALPQVVYTPFHSVDRIPVWGSSSCLDRLAPQRSSAPSWRKLATVEAAREATDLFDRLFRSNPLTTSLRDLQNGLRNLVSDRRVRPTDRSDRDSLRSLLIMLQGIDSLLDEPGLQWAFDTSLSLGPEYERILTGLEVSSFVMEGFAGQIRTSGQGNFERLQTDLVEMGSESTGPFLQSMDDRPKPELREELRLLMSALEAFLSEQGFQPSALSVRSTDPLGPDRRLLWDDILLEDAVGLWEPYQRFRTDTLVLVPESLRPTLDRIARDQTAQRVSVLVRQAQRFLSLEQTGGFDLELGISTQVDNLNQATPHLQRLVEIYRDLDQPQARNDLVDTVQRQGTRLLSDVDALLGRSRLYLPREGDFSWWEGRRAVAFAAFAVPDEPGLQDYLARQRKRIVELTDQYARPTLDALALTRPTSPARSSELQERWTIIADVLTSYADGAPTNALQDLETFIQTELPTIELLNCLPETADAGAIDTENNYFLERRKLLETLLHRRCDLLVGRKAAAAWREIETLFNQRLAGRFPFSRDRSGTPDAVGLEATTTSLNALFDLVGSRAELIRSVPTDHTIFQGSGPLVSRFLDDLDTLEAFLAPFLASPDGEALPQVLVQVDFRADRKSERSGDQILAWELTVADQAIDIRDAEPRVAWQMADDLAFVLRWAKDSPWVPRATLPQSAASSIDGTRAIYRYRDAWSLVSFVRTHLDRARFAEPSTTEPLPLRFDVQTVPRILPRDGADTFGTAPIQEARVYVRTAFFHPETEEPLPWPCFPTRAPQLGDTSSGTDRNWWCHGS